MLTKKVIVSSVGILAASVMPLNFIQINNTSAVEQNTQFTVNVKDAIAVSITTQSEGAIGNVNTFLRNKVSVGVSSNAANGFTVSMTTKTASTNLVHTANKGTIPTLASSSTRSAFPANYWGYSVNDTDAGSDSSTYSALVGAGSTPITLISNAQSSTVNSKDIYFGAKADATKASGTYRGTIVISVVTGTIDNNNPVTPSNPATPASPEETPHYSGTGTTTGGTTNGSTAYTYTRTSGSGSSATSTTTTQVSDGDNRNAYVGYTPPQGVTNRQISSENITEGSSLATGLAVTSAIAATSGVIFFILAKRKKDDDEEEEGQQQQ